MRRFMLVLTVASLGACNSNSGNNETAQVEPTPAALTYDGADYGDDQVAMLAHGERLSHLLGCRGCHTETLTGQRFPPEEDFPDTGIFASNITRVMPAMTDEQLDALIRKGVHPTRETMWMMPSEIFQFLSDSDVKALIAHLRTVEPTGEPTPPPAPTEAFLAMVANGQQNPPVAAMVAAHQKNQPEDLGPEFALGRYVAMTTCAECHAAKLEGYEEFTPDLRDVAPMYDEAAFRKLLTTGEGLEGRKLGLMALVGRAHFGALTENERSAVIAYVKKLAETEAGQPQ